jgi:hypothetical protein
MLPVTTRPPRRPGGFGSPYGKPTEIDLAKHDGFLVRAAQRLLDGQMRAAEWRLAYVQGAAFPPAPRANGNGE